MTKEEAIEKLRLFDFIGSNEDEEFLTALNMAIEALENQKTGLWIMNPKGIYAHLVCNKCLSNAPYDYPTNYCPNCGADMRGEQNE